MIRAERPDYYSDGLWLQVTASDIKRRIFRLARNWRREDIGSGQSSNPQVRAQRLE